MNMTHYLRKFEAIGRVLIKEELNYLELTASLNEYKTLLLELSGLDMEDENNRQNIQMDNGHAIGLTWAVMCIDDIMRTKYFVKGIYEAIQDVLQTKKTTTHLFYAGTGPFATLVLPLLTILSKEELQVSLLEINETSLNYLKDMITKLGLNGYVKEFIEADATKYQLDKNAEVDILLSETMLKGLEKEQQVPIVYNLLPQLKEDVILIPQKIELILGKVYQQELSFEKREIASVYELTKEMVLRGTQPIQIDDKTIFSEKIISISDDLLNDDIPLSTLTFIQVYKNNVIDFQQSGLTLSTKIQFEGEKSNQISVKYVVERQPRLYYKYLS
jgi:predicted RNA methylase